MAELRDILSLCSNSRVYGELLAALSQGNAALFAVPESVQSIFTAALDRADRAQLVVAPDVKSASALFKNYRLLRQDKQAELFLPHESVAFELADGDAGLTNSCIRTLSALVSGEPLTVFTTAAALRRRWIPPQAFVEAHIKISRGMRLDMRLLQHRLCGYGYRRSTTVREVGEFCVRGSILDIFPPNHAEPLRIDFFDDEIDSIKHFVAETQRSCEVLDEAILAPAVLLPADAKVMNEAVLRLKSQLVSLTAKLSPEPAAALQREYAPMQELLREGIMDFNAERMTTLFYPEAVLLPAFFDSGSLFLCEPDGIKRELAELQKAALSRYGEMLEAGQLLPSFWDNFCEPEQLTEVLGKYKLFLTGELAQSFGLPLAHYAKLTCRSLPVYYNNPALLQEDCRFFAQAHKRIVFSASSPLRVRRLQEIISEFSLGGIELMESGFSGGFECDELQIALFTEKELLGSEARRKQRRRKSEGRSINNTEELAVGDYVVHINHGIGRYMGVQHLVLDGAARDYILIEYSGTDRLFLPIDQLDAIHKYIGNEGEPPRVNKLSGNEWERTKAKVRKIAADIAGTLLKLYAQREQAQGYAFSADTPWQREFEDAFAYEETVDQLKAWQEIEADMQRPVPMDRLLCGDVGYGKTEIAMRAAFKAAADGKQVAVLVPTTVLAQQHYETFTERFMGFPVNIGMLSRFTSPQKTKELKARAASGKLDIIIGTHRLLSKDMRFRDLGLLVVDEEQRFGVAHKEKIKSLKHNIDVLTLSATPIPRTLHMSMVGMRDMSAITTPPEDRLPVQTYVLEYNERIIRDAIVRELSRGGQVFYLHNRVFDIKQLAERLNGLVPEAVIGIGHGQMSESELEQVMLDFTEGRSNILVCTTIIESGIDMPNVNTLIVEDADKLGLAQLYQLRGRVGRSNRQAFAYFAYNPAHIINEAARKRLIAIRDFTQLGSGFRIAMRDMEIRGAGNILGAEQSGHIAAVGFDLYCRLVSEEVERQKSGGIAPIAEAAAPLLELQLKTYIPDDYIAEEELKLDIYKQIATAASLDEVDALSEELTDRFGEPPAPVINLLALGKIKFLAHKLGIASIIQSKNFAQSVAELTFAPYHSIDPAQLATLAKVYPKNLLIKANSGLVLKYRLPDSAPTAVTESLIAFLSVLDTCR